MWEGFVKEYGSTYAMESFADDSVRVYKLNLPEEKVQLHGDTPYAGSNIPPSGLETATPYKTHNGIIKSSENPRKRKDSLSLRIPQKGSNSQLSCGPRKFELYTQLNKVELPPIGLKNYGANCYANAGIQCLCCVPEMNSYFLDEKYEEIDYMTCKEFNICKGLTKLYTCMRNEKDKDYVSPKDFVSLLPSGQQDTHEFFYRRLFPNIEDEANPKIKKQRGMGFNSKQNWDWYTFNHRSILDALFAGQLETRVECEKCGNVSISYDSFMDISLPITGTNLRDCLISNFEREVLSKDDMYRCEKCQKVKKANKAMKIDKCPKYLLLHLKRLIGGHNKINKQISYPLEIDMSK